jgi:hypothetical protein
LGAEPIAKTSARFAIEKLDAIDRTDILAHAAWLGGVIQTATAGCLKTKYGKVLGDDW